MAEVDRALGAASVRDVDRLFDILERTARRLARRGAL